MLKNILSIRLSSDGLSFWTGDRAEAFDTEKMSIAADAEAVTADYSFSEGDGDTAAVITRACSEFKGILKARGVEVPGKIIVYCDTLSSVLVPSDIFSDGDQTRYLKMNNISVGDGMFTVCSKPVHQTVAVMVVSRPAMEALGEALGRFAVASASQYNLMLGAGETREHGIRVFTTPRNCYISAWAGGRLTFCDCYPMESAADLAYYIKFLDGTLRSDSWPLAIRGYRAQELSTRMSKVHEGSVCAL